MQKIDSKKIRILSSFIFFLVTLFTSYSLGEIFYNSIDGTDFYRYFKYIEYFRGDIESPSREQGVFYFWIITLLIEYSQNFFLADKWEYIYSTAIQLGNFILYLIGIIGFILLMRFKKINWEKIFLTLSVLNFLPPVFGGRLIMKPEVLAFTLLPWVLLSLYNYFENKNKTSLILSMPLLAVLATSKGSIALISFVALLVIFYPYINRLNFQDLIFPFVVFLVSFYLIFSENIAINNVSLFNHEEESGYLFKAPIAFIYQINIADLTFNPFRNNHSNSLIGITLIDLFGDYFNRYWDNPRSIFIKDRIDLFDFLPNQRRNVSVILSILFIFFSFKKPDRFNLIYLSGIVVVTLTSLGLFGLHFNPLKGDTVKTHYYFFLIAISFIFIFPKYLNNKKFYFQIFKSLMLITLFLFILGFPKNYSQETKDLLSNKIPTTVTCSISKSYFKNLLQDDIQCLTKEIATCGFSESYNKPIEHEDGYLIFTNDELFNPVNLNDKNGFKVTVNGYAECLHYVNGGYFYNNGYFNLDRLPKTNNAYIYICIISILGILKTTNSKKYKLST